MVEIAVAPKIIPAATAEANHRRPEMIPPIGTYLMLLLAAAMLAAETEDAAEETKDSKAKQGF